MPAPARRGYDRLAHLVGVIAMLSALRLVNGVTVVHAARPGPVAAVEVWLGAGTADEPAAAPGVAHAVEHMVFRAGLGVPLATAIAALGGDINAWTGFDHTVVHAAVPARALPAAVGTIAAAVARPALAPDPFDAERGVLAAELRGLAADPARAVARAVFRQLFLVHPYRRPVGGTAAALDRLAARDLATFFTDWYVGANTVVVIAGGPDLGALAPVLGRFGALAARPIARVPRREPVQTALRAAVVPGTGSHVAFGLRTGGTGDVDRDALDVLAAALAPRSTAAHHVLRDGGAWIVSTARAGAAAAIAADAAAELAALGALDDAAVARAVTALEASALRAGETAAGAARALGRIAAELDVARLPIERVAPSIMASAQARLDRRRALAAADVRAVARDRFRPDRLAVAVLTSRRASARPVATAVRRRLLGKSVADASVHVHVHVARARARARSETALDVRRVELPNGLVVLIAADKAAPIVAIRALWSGGSRLEDTTTAGATALLARVLPRGCGDRDAAATDAAVAEHGGVLAGTAGRNGFGLHAEWPASAWAAGLELVADCVLAPRLDAGEIAAARADQLAQLDAVDADPGRIAAQLFSQALYRDHPYALDPLGTPDSLANLTADDLIALYRDRYPVSRLVLTVVGDVDPDAVVAAVERRFAAAARPRRLAAAIDAPVVDGRPATEREVYLYRDGTEAEIVIGFPATRITGADRHAVAVLAAILDGPAGRLFAALRDRDGLVYRIGVHAVDGVDTGYLAITTTCAPADADRVVAAVRAELAALADDGATADELDRARAQLTGAHARAAERRADVAHGLAFAEAHGAGWQAYVRYPDAIAGVTAADVAAAARRYLRWDRAVIATVRPPAATPAATRKSRGRVETPRGTAAHAARKRARR